jgi:hypothetical protein
MGKTLRDEQVLFAELQHGIEQARATLGAASWCASWDQTEPHIERARAQLAGVVSIGLVNTLDEAAEIVWTGAHEALQLVLRTVDTAIQFASRGQEPTFAVPRLIREAIATLDDAVAGGR